jgi:hypothetical protein
MISSPPDNVRFQDALEWMLKFVRAPPNAQIRVGVASQGTDWGTPFAVIAAIDDRVNGESVLILRPSQARAFAKTLEALLWAFPQEIVVFGRFPDLIRNLVECANRVSKRSLSR